MELRAIAGMIGIAQANPTPDPQIGPHLPERTMFSQQKTRNAVGTSAIAKASARSTDH